MRTFPTILGQRCWRKLWFDIKQIATKFFSATVIFSCVTATYRPTMRGILDRHSRGSWCKASILPVKSPLTRFCLSLRKLIPWSIILLRFLCSEVPHYRFMHSVKVTTFYFIYLNRFSFFLIHQIRGWNSIAIECFFVLFGGNSFTVLAISGRTYEQESASNS